MNTSLKSNNNLSPKEVKSIQSDLSVAFGDNENQLLRRALFKTNDPELSQDLVQMTFLKTLLYLQRGGKIGLMRSFLNRVLSDLIIDEYRKTNKVSLDDLLKKGFEPGACEYKRNADVLDGKHAIKLLSQLPKKYSRVIELRYLKGLSLKEVALLTGQSENTVAVQVHRGLHKLREVYQEQAEQCEKMCRR